MEQIFYRSVFRKDKDLGKAYNIECALLPDNEWICLIDGDAMFLHPQYGNHLEQVIDSFELAGLDARNVVFTTKTNRVWNPKQLHLGKIDNDVNLNRHVMIAKTRWHEHTTDTSYMDPKYYPLSGVVMLFHKSLWHKVKFRETGKALGIDNHFHGDVERAGFEVRVMEGVYVLHKYRIGQPTQDTSHLTD